MLNPSTKFHKNNNFFASRRLRWLPLGLSASASKHTTLLLGCYRLRVEELMVEEQRSLMNAIRVRQRNWIGDILRGNSLLRTALEGKMEGKRTRGKPRIEMLDRIMTEGHTKLSYDELKSAAQDRLKWRHHYQDLPTQAEN